MFLNSLKATSIARKIDKYARERVFSPLTAMPVAIGILQDDAHKISPTFISNLNKVIGIHTSSKVEVLTYIDSANKNPEETEYHFSDKDIGWNGTLKKDSLKKFSRKHFDILISYYNTDELSLKLITTASQAYLKVGVTNDLEAYSDLTIKTALENEQLFTTELKKYLIALKIIQ